MISEEYEYESASQQGHSAAMHYVRNFGKNPKTDVLDKIRAEIEDLDIFYDNDYFSSNRDAMFKCSDVLQIIDKYRESEG